MYPKHLSNQDLYDLGEEIHYPNRCQIDGCPDEIIGDPNGVDHYCFKHYIDPDL
jgi:hypothetical protein